MRRGFEPRMKARRRPPWPGIALAGVCLLSGLSVAAGPATAGAAPASCTPAPCIRRGRLLVRGQCLHARQSPRRRGCPVAPSSWSRRDMRARPPRTIPLGSSGFSIATSRTSATSPVVIEPAPGVQTPILDGGGKHPVLKVGNAMHLVISGLVIQDGFSDASIIRRRDHRRRPLPSSPSPTRPSRTTTGRRTAGPSRTVPAARSRPPTRPSPTIRPASAGPSPTATAARERRPSPGRRSRATGHSARVGPSPTGMTARAP